MLGLIVVATEGAPGLSPEGQLEDLLGVPVLARSIAAALPADEPVTGVLVVPERMVDDVRARIVERFGFDEIERVVAGGPTARDAIQAGLAALADDVELVIVQRGAEPLAPVGLVERVIAAAQAGEAACGAIEIAGHVVADEGDGLVPLDVRPRLRLLQGPFAAKRATLKAALDATGTPAVDDAPALVAEAGGSVSLVAGDRDNLLLADAADLGRAVEVFARRAVDFAFVYPKDLLPDDPLKAALEATSASGDRGADADHASDEGNGASSA